MPLERIEGLILFVRGHKAILDVDLAKLYGVSTKALNQAVKRNRHRFPGDFLFLLTPGEKQEVVTNCDHLKSLKYSFALPYAFTEHGAIMAATVLNSSKAVDMSVYVVRAFVKLRRLLATHKELAKKLEELERHVKGHDQEIQAVISAIRQLMIPPESLKRRIGF